jgi:hypothetical protein
VTLANARQLEFAECALHCALAHTQPFSERYVGWTYLPASTSKIKEYDQQRGSAAAQRSVI